MKAMIFAAGLGTRLRPLTFDKPKALIKVGGVPLLELAIKRLKFFGFNDIIINIHYLAQQIIDFLDQKNNFNAKIVYSDESNLLLDTGGGLKKAGWFLDGNEPFLLYNVDILSKLDLKSLYESHINSSALATLAIQDQNASRSLLFNKENELCGWKNSESGKTILVKGTAETLYPKSFTGIHLISPTIFKLIEEDGVFSIINLYLRLAEKHIIQGYSHNNAFWMDLGTPKDLEKGNQVFSQHFKKLN